MLILLMAAMATRALDEDNVLPPLVEAPPVMMSSSRSTHRSIETLVVVLAVITIVAVMAGVVARICGGRHFGGNGEHDIEGWVERKCRSCIDSGVPVAELPVGAKGTTGEGAGKV